LAFSRPVDHVRACSDRCQTIDEEDGDRRSVPDVLDLLRERFARRRQRSGLMFRHRELSSDNTHDDAPKGMRPLPGLEMQRWNCGIASLHPCP